MQNKWKPWIDCLMGAVLAWLLSVGAVGCMVTGFELQTVSMGAQVLWCAGFALVSAAILRFRYGTFVLLGLTVLICPFLWQKGALWYQFDYILFPSYIMIPDILTGDGTQLSAVKATLPSIALALWTAFSVSWCICRRKHALYVLPPVASPVVLCLIFTQDIPHPGYLYLLLTALALLFITDWTRRKVPAQSTKLMLRAALPIALAFAVLFGANPEKTYVNHAWKIQEKVESWLQWDDGVQSDNIRPVVSKRLNLKNLGPKSRSTRAVMRVIASADGKVYLRELDYDLYTATGWGVSTGRSEAFTSGGAGEGTLTVTTFGNRSMRYIPYYPAERTVLTDGKLENEENLKSYSYQVSYTPSGGVQSPEDRYIQLPDETRQWAERLVRTILPEQLTTAQKAAAIENHVENSADYDLRTSPMNGQYGDFAQWFLEESDTGYCVHFATAATVLLRAAGVPARYVEGYMVTCKGGQPTEVTFSDGHAWAEYYDEERMAWCILEATPADSQASIDIPTESTDVTEPENTATLPQWSNPGSSVDTTAPSRDTRPTADTPTDNSPSQTGANNAVFLKWLLALLSCAAGALTLLVQSSIRMAWKRRRWQRGEPNEKTVNRWYQARKMARRLGEPFPEELEELALKAKFSQYTISPEELAQFDVYREVLLHKAGSQPWYRQLWLRVIFAMGR